MVSIKELTISEEAEVFRILRYTQGTFRPPGGLMKASGGKYTIIRLQAILTGKTNKQTQKLQKVTTSKQSDMTLMVYEAHEQASIFRR